MLAAFIGTAMNNLDVSPVMKLWIGLAVDRHTDARIPGQFRADDPAALLPIFLDLHDYIFAIATAVFTFVIMLAAFMMRKADQAPAGRFARRRIRSSSRLSWACG